VASPRAPQRLTVEAPVVWATPTQIWVKLPAARVTLEGESVILPATQRRLDRLRPQLDWESQKLAPGEAVDWYDKPFYPLIDGRWATAEKATYYAPEAWAAYQSLLADAASPDEATEPPSPHAALLGLGAQVSRDEVLRAFRARAMAAHPDKGGDPDYFRRLIVARDTLLARS